MNKERLQLLKELTEIGGVSGYETEVKNVLKKHLKGLADISYDKIGSIIFKKEGDSASPKIMIPGHMDEVGFMVRFITDDGFIKFLPLGGWFAQVILSQRVIIKSSKGDYTGIVGSKPPHILTEEEKKKVVEIKDMFIDVGASSKKEVEEDFGIKPGDPIVPFSEFKEMGNKKNLLAKAWDDRVGCALFIDVIKELQKTKHPNTVYGVGTVQEEVGLRGARTSSWVVEPDVAIIAEVGLATDVPGVKQEEVVGKLGKGPQITILDAGMIPNLKLRDLVVDIAKKKKIPFQFTSVNRGATDGGVIHLHTRGVPCIYIGVPTRYIHSQAGIINTDDYENTLKLILETVKVLDEKKVKELIP
ncbi:MAG: M42 family metallopeptidase [Candidatus Firestonebacteria bacterium]